MDKVLLKIKFDIMEDIESVSFKVVNKQDWDNVFEFLSKYKNYKLSRDYNGCDSFTSEQLLSDIEVIDDPIIISSFIIVHGNTFYTNIDVLEELLDFDEDEWRPDEYFDSYWTQCVGCRGSYELVYMDRYCKWCTQSSYKIKAQCKYIYDGIYSGKRCRNNIVDYEKFCEKYCKL